VDKAQQAHIDGEVVKKLAARSSSTFKNTWSASDPLIVLIAAVN